MSRYTHAELNRTALDAVTLSTPTSVLEVLQYHRVEVILADEGCPSELQDQIRDAFAEAYDALDQIERGRR